MDHGVLHQCIRVDGCCPEVRCCRRSHAAKPRLACPCEAFHLYSSTLVPIHSQEGHQEKRGGQEGSNVSKPTHWNRRSPYPQEVALFRFASRGSCFCRAYPLQAPSSDALGGGVVIF